MKSKLLNQFYCQKRILITGGLGFIGSNLAIRLVKLGANVTIIDSLVPGLGGNRVNINPVKTNVHLIVSDLNHLSTLGELLKTQEIVFNLAGTHSHIDSMKDPLADLSLTAQMQLSFLETCRKSNPNLRILMAGTRNQYGKPTYLPIDENHPLNPIDINGAHWLAVENYHLLYHRVYGLKTCSLRLTNTYGPRHQMKTPFQGILNWFIRLILDNKPITLYGKGMQKRDCLYADDVVEAFLLAGASRKAWGEVFNLGGTVISLTDFCKLLVSIYGQGKIQYIPYPKDHARIEPGDYHANWQKIAKTLGWKPKTSLTTGIMKTLDYYKTYKKQYW